ncbi:MAG TPA: GNAT family N-acetyltransferase [Patescibacteria group bacterium]|nr:GNAT family N-acetyltransferase [Patescibacteria group bacterium]
MQVIFEKMDIEHQKSIMKVFNYYIETSTSAFPASTLPEEFYLKFMEMTKGYPAYAIVNSETHEVVGFCMMRAYNPFSSFNETAEISYFISKDYVGKRIGEQCLKKLESEAKQMGIKHIIAEISSENQQSLGFHNKHGFRTCGSLKNIGNKFERNFDVVYMQKDLD